MKRTISEQKVLNRLGITDFRHMSKDKLVQFVSMLPHMDPEVAKKALEQFPSFAEYAGKIVSEYRNILEATLKDNNNSQSAFYHTCDSIISILEQELQKDSLSKDEREYIEEAMIKVAQMVFEKDSENKHFILKVITAAGVTLLSVVVTASSILGVNHQARFPNDF